MFRNTLLLMTIGIIVITGWCYAIQVDGYCYLWNQTNHDSIKILFWEYYYNTPIDSTYTDSTGYYQIDVAQDNYDIQFRHLGYYNHEKYNQYVYNNITFRNIFLHPASGTPIQGNIHGTLPADTFLVWNHITVQQGQNLIIQPGAVLLFDGRFGFNVEGSLSTIGTESDSIKLMPSPVASGWRGIRLRNSQFSIMEYCLVTGSIYRGIDGGTNSTIRYCTITNNTGTMSSNGDGIVCWNSSPTIEYSTISNNENRGIYCTFDASPVIRNCTISGNSCGITLSGDGNPIIQNCTITGNSGGVFDEGGGIGVFSSSAPLISNCTIINNYSYYGGGVYISTDGYMTMKNCNISENSAYLGGGGIRLNNTSPTISNCTISGNYSNWFGGGIHFHNSSSTIINSIISGNTGSGGLYFQYQTANVNVSYSDIWGNDEGNFLGLYVPENLGQIITVNANGDSCDQFFNIMIDPKHRGGYPFDYGLQANSPCIDAADPTSTYDPDGTIADMGVYYFDQLIDQPPALISPVEAWVQRGAVFRYVAHATDDNGPLQFGFWNLPPWLHRVHRQLDWMENTAILSGRTPVNQQDFTFGVWVEDGVAHRDSQEVSVYMNEYHVLYGPISGVLTVSESPYLVVEDAFVPEGDSLRIEPGVEVRFRYHENWHFRRRIIVRGYLFAVGTPQDSIRFVPEYGDSLQKAFRGIWCTGVSADTSIISYAYFQNGYYGVTADSSSTVKIDHCQFRNTYHSIHSRNNAQMYADSCQSYSDRQGSSDHLAVGNNGSLFISNCHSEYLQETNTGTHVMFWSTADGIVQNNTFVGGWGCSFPDSNHIEFIGNRLQGCSESLWIANDSWGIVANNIFTNGSGLRNYGTGSMLVSNNLFYRTDIGIESGYLDQLISIRNNVFVQNRHGIEVHSGSPPYVSVEYCDFFENDSDLVNITGQYDLFLDPQFQDTVDFRLSFGSPCIDAGDPDPFFNDPDSTRNDIGAWGGPWGESYQYPTLFATISKPIPLEFALHPPYPNPFNASTVIKYTLPQSGKTELTVYNILGQQVTTLIDRTQQPGTHSIIWDTKNLPSGIYFARLKCKNFCQVQKMLLLK